MDLYDLTPGFDDPELGSQQTFRAIVKALDNPGSLVQIKSKLSAPSVLNSASAALFLTLCHNETKVWADLTWNYPLIDWFQYQCGCSIVTEPCMASLALITKSTGMPPLDHFRNGDDEHSDVSAKLIVQIGELSPNASMQMLAAPCCYGGRMVRPINDVNSTHECSSTCSIPFVAQTQNRAAVKTFNLRSGMLRCIRALQSPNRTRRCP